MMEPSSTKKKEFECLHCPFKDRRKATFEKHNACHNRDPAAKYQCAFCSYSTHNPVKLLLHVKLHSEDISKENNKNIGDRDQSNSATPSKRKEVQWHVYPDGTRKRYKLCDYCDYKTLKNKSLYSHIKAWHPKSATTESQPGTTTNQSKAAPLKRKAEQWHIYPDGTRKRRKLCHDCDYHTLHQSSLDRHIELLHPVTATTAAGSTTRKETFNNIDEHQNAEKDNGILPVVLNDIEERRVSLHDIHSSPAKGNSESMELLPLEEPDQVSGVDEPEDGKIQSLQGRVIVMQEKARIAEEEVKHVLSKMMNVKKRINEVTGRRMVIELDMRLEQRNLLEMRIFAHDAEEDYTGLMETVERKVGSLKTKMDAIEGQLISLKEEKNVLGYDLECSQASHFGVAQVIEALNWELDGLFQNP